MNPPKITRSLSTAYYGQFTLGQLRELVEAASDLGDNAVVDVKSYSDQRDGSSVSFNIRESVL